MRIFRPIDREVIEKTVATTYDLRITGSVEAIHLEPGDKILITIDQHITPEQAARLKEQCQAVFPDNEAVVLTSGLRIARQQATA